MESLFRFVIARPPTAINSDLALALERPSKLQQELLASIHDRQPRKVMKDVATRFAGTGRMVRAASDLHFGAGFARMRAELGTVTSIAELPARIATWFGMSVDKLLSAPELADDDERTADSLVVIKLLPAEQHAPAVALADVLRHVSIIRRLAAFDADLSSSGGLDRARSRPLVLPPRLFPIPSGGPKDATGTIPSKSHIALSHARQAVEQLQATVDELMSLDVSALAGDGDATPVIPTDGQDGVRGAAAAATRARRLAPLILKPAAATALTGATRNLLTARRLDLSEVPLDRVVSSIVADLSLASRRLASAETQAAKRARVGIIGRTPVPINAAPPIPMPGPGPGTIPTSHGTIHSVGVADLLVVKQALKRYDAKDIAHLENVLQGESKRRTHERSTTTEQLTMFETEHVREQERELESTDRFEMKRATSETISETASLTTGLTVSGNYGPTVDFEASVQGAMESARERSVEVASSYSRDVTERSRTKLTETVHDMRSLRIVNTIAEKNEHALDNTAGSHHVVGIYQWLEKVYEAQVFNYGLRALFDFIVPEPAAFAIHAMQAGFTDATQIDKPLDFEITPAQITETNYHQYVRNWEATGVAPPPEPFVTVTKTFRGGPDAPDGNTRGMTVDAVDQPLPEGYRALAATLVARWGHWDNDNDMTIKLTVGRRAHTFASGDPVAWSTSLDGEVGTIAVAVRTWRTSSFTAAIEITCQRTPRAMEKWQLETYAQLLVAFQQQRSIYEEKLKGLRARAGVEISGKNPAFNRELELRELKKACISILSDQHFEVFDSIEIAPDGIPETNVAEIGLEGPYTRFFEQAFEWQNSTYVFYPYFWGRRSTWIDRFHYDDTDPLFAAFLRAGAARVVVPVRPGFELLVDHFMATGEVWQGGEPPPISCAAYVPIIQELAEHLGAPGDEVPQGDPWDVLVPTSLVLLRSDNQLPRWHKDPDRQWVADES